MENVELLIYTQNWTDLKDTAYTILKMTKL